MATGDDIGSVAGSTGEGAAAGAVFGPYGAIIGGAIGLTKGIFDLSSGNKKKKEAEANLPPLEDPEMRQYLNELNLKRKTMATGSAYANEYNQLLNQQADTDTGIISASGGAGGAAIAGLLKAQRGTGVEFGNLITRNEGNVNNANKMYLALLDEISKRKFSLQENRYAQLMGEGTEQAKTGEENIMAGAARILPMVLPKSKKFVNPMADQAPIMPISRIQAQPFDIQSGAPDTI